MSYFDDYVADGLCCEICGEVIDMQEPGYPRVCKQCDDVFQQKVDKRKRNMQRTQYAIEQFRKNGIVYFLKNEITGHFHVYRKSDRQLFQFWSGTGKITGPIPDEIEGDRRGIATLIKILIGG